MACAFWHHQAVFLQEAMLTVSDAGKGPSPPPCTVCIALCYEQHLPGDFHGHSERFFAVLQLSDKLMFPAVNTAFSKLLHF